MMRWINYKDEESIAYGINVMLNSGYIVREAGLNEVAIMMDLGVVCLRG